ncbi:MAG: glutamate-5-semialdehyde dehydrogenase [bacterium]
MEMEVCIQNKAKLCRESSRKLAIVSSLVKNRALELMSKKLYDKADFILEENQKDLEEAKKNGLSTAMLDRLNLNEKRIEAMRKGLIEVMNLPDPVGEVTKMQKRPNGLVIGRMRVPIGAIGIIYESRPNVTIEAASLCIKAGNSVLLRGGSEAIRSNIALAKILIEAAKETGLPEECIQIIEVTDREAVMKMLKQDKYLDVIIPRGGEELIKTVVENSSIPVIKHDKGVCHVFVDESADFEMADKIIFNAKVQRPGVCNAMETLLVHEKIAKKLLPVAAKSLTNAKVTLKGCPKAREILHGIEEAVESDWTDEYLDLILSIRVVKDLNEAVEHINFYGSHHSDAIITSSYENSRRFLQEVDSAAVYVNASTRFTDGGQFGLGAEIGISTNKLHARGPMGLEELTTSKFIIYGSGQVRE